MKITKKLLAACVAALALSIALMGCNGGNTPKPAGSAAGSASKQTIEKKESKKPADDRIDFTWFKAYAPEGYDVWARSGSDGNVSEILFNGIEDSNKVISFGVSSTKDAETVVTNDSARDGYERGEDVTIGGIPGRPSTSRGTRRRVCTSRPIFPTPEEASRSPSSWRPPTIPPSRHSLSPLSSAKKISKKRSLRPRTLASRTSARRMDLLSPERESSVTSNMTPHAE